jgi:hypothetical protein
MVRRNRSFLYGGVAGLIMIAITVALRTFAQLHQQAEMRAVETSLNLAKSLELTFEGMINGHER